MKMSFFWKIVPVAAFAAFALVACDSGSSSDSDVADLSSSAAAQSSGSSSSGMESGGSSAALSSSVAALSSSSVAGSSSNVAKSSSSKANWAYLNPAISYGEFTDDRDGHAYKYVKIGTQTWMAQNLNYAVGRSWCYNDDADSCAKYGRLYQWAAAMNVSTSYSSVTLGDSVNHQGACPAGWHVPTSGEWNTLATAVSGWATAGTRLKSTSGWYNSGNGTDSYGFSALPAGLRYNNGDFYSAGSYAYFWSATELGADNAYIRYLHFSNAYMDANYYDNKNYGYSVRCVQDF